MIPPSKEEFKAILDRQQQNGLSIRDFCSNEAYTVSSFHYWKSKFGFTRLYRSHSREDSVPPVIAPVSLKSADPAAYRKKPETQIVEATQKKVTPKAERANRQLLDKLPVILVEV